MKNVVCPRHSAEIHAVTRRKTQGFPVIAGSPLQGQLPAAPQTNRRSGVVRPQPVQRIRIVRCQNTSVPIQTPRRVQFLPGRGTGLRLSGEAPQEGRVSPLPYICSIARAAPVGVRHSDTRSKQEPPKKIVGVFGWLWRTLGHQPRRPGGIGVAHGGLSPSFWGTMGLTVGPFLPPPLSD